MFSRGLLALALSANCSLALSGETRQLVDVGDHRLDVRRGGSGAPTVVFEVGLASVLEDWDPVFPQTAAFTSAVAYSRAGLGKSESGSQDHSARSEVVELHTLLGRLHLAPPYVLVGRSYGGILVRLYMSLYPQDVAGLVLVDGSHEQQVRRWGLIDSTYPDAFRVFYDSVLKTNKTPAEAAETRESVRIQAAGAVEGMKPLPDIPIAVITSMKSDPKAVYVNGTPRGHDAWRAMHDEWFQQSRNGIHIVTTHSGHGIQNDEPQLVIDAIRFVVERVKRP